MSRGRSAMATHWPARGAAARADRIPLAKARQLLRFLPRHIGFAPSHRSRTVQPRRSAPTSRLFDRRGLLRAAACRTSVPSFGLRGRPGRRPAPSSPSYHLPAPSSGHPHAAGATLAARRGILTPQAPRSPRSDLKSISPRATSPSISIVFTPLSTARRRVDQPVEWLAAYGTVLRLARTDTGLEPLVDEHPLLASGQPSKANGA